MARMRYWKVGTPYNRIRVKARSARAAGRKYMRGNWVHDSMCRDHELDNPFNPRYELPSEMPDEMKRWKKMPHVTAVTWRDLDIEDLGPA